MAKPAEILNLAVRDKVVEKYWRKMDKDEFRKEMKDHLMSTPEGYTENQFELLATIKSQCYDHGRRQATNAVEQLMKLAETMPEENQCELQMAISAIEDSVGAFGAAALSGNSDWNPQWNYK